MMIEFLEDYLDLFFFFLIFLRIVPVVKQHILPPFGRILQASKMQIQD